MLNNRLYALLLFGLILGISACNDNGAGTAAPVDAAACKSTDVKVNEGETADLGCLKLTISDAVFANAQLNFALTIENLSETPLPLKVPGFTVKDSKNATGAATTCGGTGGFSGTLAKNEKLDSHLCWFLANAAPPITVSYSGPGGGNAIFQLKVK